MASPGAGAAGPGLRATYRLQLREGIGFAEAAALAPYLAALGISHLYLSPPFTARSGSVHGYDVADPGTLDPVLGGMAGFEAMAAALAAEGIGLIIDIVPNHMAASPENPWWRDVLRWGPDSPRTAYFDIDWEGRAGAGPGRLLLPILGEPYGKVLASGEMRLAFAPDTGELELVLFENRLPLHPQSYPQVLEGVAGVQALAAAFARATPGDFGAALDRLRAALAGSAEAEAALEAALERIAGDPRRLHRLLEAQPWRLAWWRLGPQALNYRRFFDITELAGLRVERPEVFADTHAAVLDLTRRRLIDGVRVDHVDGLRDPGGYLEALRGALDAAGAPAATIHVEKILGTGEVLPEDWPVAGTTGYEVLTDITDLYVDPAAEAALAVVSAAFTGDPRPHAAVVDEAKREILRRSLRAELERLAIDAHRLAGAGLSTRDLGRPALAEALTACLVALPVYRTYRTEAPPSEADRAIVEATLAEAGRDLRPHPAAALAFLGERLLDPALRGDALDLVARLQQLSGALMAKAVEDTAFYRHLPLATLNEVGGDPTRFGLSIEGFHTANAARLARTPAGLIATATHDTKRGEDCRLRIAALSEVPGRWAALIGEWRALNAPLRAGTPDPLVPNSKHEYLLYQTLVGAWPAELAPDDAAGLATLAERVGAYMRKAAREGKERTSWTQVDEEYEAGLAAFVAAILDPERSARFLASLAELVRELAPLAAAHGLSQALLKLTIPGVPDIYQGTEFWDLSLVDPDNRRPVDFAARHAALADAGDAAALLASAVDGRIKQRLMVRVLAFRRARPELFAVGAYRPLVVRGRHAERIVAFARGAGSDTAVAVAPVRLGPLLLGRSSPLPPAEAWDDTAVETGEPDVDWVDAVSGRSVRAGPDGSVRLADLLAAWPVALLTR